MITAVTMYEAQCDRCKEVFFHDPYDDNLSLFNTRISLESLLKSYGWKTINGKLYCNNCAREVQGGER